MKRKSAFIILISLCFACAENKNNDRISLEGTWQLFSGTIIENGDTTITVYGKDRSMIKIINETHFSFLNHDLMKGKDSTQLFAAGGGRYILKGDEYTEFLEYCSDRDWEGHTFQFRIQIKKDTLMQTGIEKVEELGIERQNTETYVRMRE
jgi:hypothetical protein